MNRVYKVIWSKAKHCYVVTSEIAKSHTKGESTGRGLKKLAAALLVAAALMGPNFAWAADPTVKVTDTSTVEQIVYTKDGADVIFATKTDLDAKANVDKDGKVTAASGQIGTVEITSAGAVSGVTDLTVFGNVEAVGNLKVGNGNFTVDGITGNVTTGYATIGDDLTVKGDTEIGGDLGVNGNIKTNKGFIQTGGGNINTQGGALRTNGGNINAGNGTITGNKLTDGVASLQAGNLNVHDITATGSITGNIITGTTITGTTGSFANEVSAGSVNVTNKLEAGSIEATGKLEAGSIEATGNLKGDSLTVTNNASVGGQLTAGTLTAAGNNFTVGADGNVVAAGVNAGAGTINTTGTVKAGDVQTGTLTTNGNATIGGALTVTGKLNMDEIDMTKVGIVGDNNVTASTKVAAGEITSYKKATSTKAGGGEKESAIDYDEKGTSTWAKATDADGKWNKSSLTVEGKGIKSIATDGTNKTYTKQTAVDIKNTAKNGTITNDAMDVLNKGANSVINKVGDNKVAVKTDSVKAAYGSDTYTTWNGKGITSNTSGNMRNSATNITNKAEEKLSNSAAEIENSASKSITDKVGENTSWKMTDGKISESIDNGTASNKENTTVDGTKRIITNGEGTGTYNQTATSNNISLKNAAGDTYFTKSEFLDGEKTSVKNPNGSSTINQSAESIVNFVKNSEGTTKTEQSAKDITNTAKNGTITNNAMDVLNKGANSVINKVGDNKVAVKTDSVKAAYGSDTYTTWNGKGITSNTSGNMRNTVGGKMLNNVTGDMENKVGGDLINTVTGDSSLSATNIKNKASTSITSQIGEDGKVKSEMTADGITNTAKDGTIYNKSKDILNEASGDIINWADGEIGNVATKITNITGDNTVTSDTNGTTFENKAHNTAVKEGTVTKTTISGNTIETGQATMDYADVTKDLSVGGNATVENDLTVKGTSEFVGEAHFRKDVYVDNDLFVTGETRTGTLYVNKDGYVDGNLYVEGNIETHDAVLSADSRQVVTGRQLYQTNERVDRLDNRIKKVGANAAALAALRPGDFNPDDKFSIAAGFGSYRNASAAALGLFYRPNENVLLSLGTSFGDGENMVNAGVSVKFGRGKSMAERRKEMADEVSSMRDEMRSQDERIAELEEMLKKQSELIEKLSKES